MTYTLTAAQLSRLRADAAQETNYLITITGEPTGGTFTLSYLDDTTAAIAFNATANAVQAALEALDDVGQGGVSVTGTTTINNAVSGPFNVVFEDGDGSALTVNAAGLTGGSSPAIYITMLRPFSDARLNDNYDQAEGDYNLAVLYTLRQWWARSAKFHNITVNGDSVNKNQIFLNIEKLLKYWEKVAGAEGGTLSVGTIGLHIDATEDDITEWGSW